MTLDTRRRVADVSLYASAGSNAVVAVMHVAAHHYAWAAEQFTLVAVLFVATDGLARFRLWMEAQIAKARADRDLAQMAFEHFAEQVKRGGVRFAVEDVPPSGETRWKN